MNEPTKVQFAKIMIRRCFYKSITHCTIKSYLKHFWFGIVLGDRHRPTTSSDMFSTPTPLLDSTFVWLLILQPIHLLSYLMRVSLLALSSLSTPQTPCDALIFLALYFSIYTHWDEQWAPGSPHSPAQAQIDTHTDTETHVPSQPCCDLRLRWRWEGFIYSVSDHMN